MENEKQIEIKIEGNTCTLNYINESQTSKSRVSGQMSLCGSLANFDDLTLTISKADEFTPSHKNTFIINQNNIDKRYDKKLENTNEKSKLEITYMSIFNSDQKNRTSSIKKTPYNQNSIKKINEDNKTNNEYEKDKKDSVIKKLNFDLCDSHESSEKKEKFSEQNDKNFKENISKNLNERYFIHEKNLNNKNTINNLNDESNVKKSLEGEKKYININKSTKHFKNRCKSFQKEKRLVNRISVDSNDSLRKHDNKNNIENININNLNKNNSSSKISIQKLSHIKTNLINNNYNNVQEIMNSEKYKERKEKLHKYFDKLAESKNDIRANYIKLTSEKLKKDSKLNNKLSKIEENIDKTEEKIKNKINDDILKTSKKLFPQLSSTNSFNTSNSKNKLGLGQLSSIKKNYYYQTPSSSNMKIGNISTSTKNATFASNLNTPIISNNLNSKINSFSKTDNKDIIMKLYYGNSTSKKIVKNNKFNDSSTKKLDRQKNEFLIDRERDSIKYLLKKHNTDLKNVLKINNKKIQTILNGKNCFGKNLNENNINNNRLNEINEFKQFIQKNQFDKELLKTIKKRGSFH
jgi:hypothetical protein